MKRFAIMLHLFVPALAVAGGFEVNQQTAVSAGNRQRGRRARR